MRIDAFGDAVFARGLQSVRSHDSMLLAPFAQASTE
jgi:hypothetical protein